MFHRIGALASVAALAASVTIASAQEIKLPPTLTFTAYDTGTAGFNIAVAVGKMMKDKYGTDVRVLPAGNDVARLAPLRAGRAVSSAMGSGTYFAQEGVFEFGAKEWGPQPLQLVLSSVDCNAGSLGVARDTGVTEIKQLRGKRVGFVVGSPALNQNALAILAFGDLKQSDVKIVEFSSYGAMWKGLINNDTDAAFATTITGPAKEAETSPRGIIWPPLPHNDKAGWERVQKVGSLLLPACRNLRRRNFAGKTDRTRQLSISDLRGVRHATGRSGLRHDQGDDRRLRRLQGQRAGRRRSRRQPADHEMGGAVPSRRREGTEGSRQLDRRRSGAQ